MSSVRVSLLSWKKCFRRFSHWTEMSCRALAGLQATLRAAERNSCASQSLDLDHKQQLKTLFAPYPVAPCALYGCSECAVSPFLYSSCRFHFAFIFLTGNCDRRQIMSTRALETTKLYASGPQSFWSSDLSRLGGRPHSQWYGCWPAHWDGKVRGQVRMRLRQGSMVEKELRLVELATREIWRHVLHGSGCACHHGYTTCTRPSGHVLRQLHWPQNGKAGET